MVAFYKWQNIAEFRYNFDTALRTSNNGDCSTSICLTNELVWFQRKHWRVIPRVFYEICRKVPIIFHQLWWKDIWKQWSQNQIFSADSQEINWLTSRKLEGRNAFWYLAYPIKGSQEWRMKSHEMQQELMQTPVPDDSFAKSVFSFRNSRSNYHI